MLAQNQRYTTIKKIDYSSFDKFHHLVRSKSLDVFICDICKEWDDEMEYRGEAELSRHQQLVHADIDRTLTDEELKNLNAKDREEVENGPETPQCENLLNRIPEEKEKAEDEMRKK